MDFGQEAACQLQHIMHHRFKQRDYFCGDQRRAYWKRDAARANFVRLGVAIKNKPGERIVGADWKRTKRLRFQVPVWDRGVVIEIPRILIQLNGEIAKAKS